MNLGDVLLILLDIFLLTLFGTALSSAINYNLSSQGQITAVGTIVSAGYGFLCGAYMPISSFNVTLQKILSFLPGTYATSLLRNHTLNGSFNKLASLNVPSAVIDELKKEFDCKMTFLGSNVSIGTMYIILILSIVILSTIFILMNKARKK